MPEIKHVFSQGKMNKDLDERLVPNGQYRHALNVQISASEGSDVGTVQNLLGNAKLSNFIGVNPKCVGAIADDKNDALYWFVKTQYYDCILEYKNKEIKPVIVDTKKDVLKFTDNIITGINIIDNLLFFTDNYNEPKKINIDFCKLGTDINGYTHTKLIVPERSIDISNNIDIREEHITLIKKSPTKPLFLDIKYPAYCFSNLSISLSRDTFATMLADAIDVNLLSPDTIFFCSPSHSLKDKGPSIISSVGFSFNFFKALIIESSVANLMPNLSISLTEDWPIP